jgi:hypothetical protein
MAWIACGRQFDKMVSQGVPVMRKPFPQNRWPGEMFRDIVNLSLYSRLSGINRKFSYF